MSYEISKALKLLCNIPREVLTVSYSHKAEYVASISSRYEIAFRKNIFYPIFSDAPFIFSERYKSIIYREQVRLWN